MSNWVHLMPTTEAYLLGKVFYRFITTPTNWRPTVRIPTSICPGIR